MLLLLAIGQGSAGAQAPLPSNGDTPASPAPSAPAPPATDDELLEARRAVEAAPRNREALTRFVAALAAAGRDDEALHWAVALGRETGDAQLVATWAQRLDPLGAERALALLNAAQVWQERGRWCSEKSLQLQAAALFEGAAALARGAASAEGETLAAEVLAARIALARSRKAADRMARHRVPFAPIENPHHSSAAPSAAPEAAAKTTRPGKARNRSVEVTCHLGQELSRDLARQSAEFIASLRKQLGDRFHAARQQGLLQVEILSSLAEYQSRRPVDSKSAVSSSWQLAFTEPGLRRIVALDPRAIGEPFERLWGLLARETCRDLLRDVEIPLPPWLEQGLCLGYEGARVRADGRFDFDTPPRHRRVQVLASLKGRGPLRPSLQQVLELQDPDDTHAVWAWALTDYLLLAENDQGELLWADRLDRLLADLSEGVDIFPQDEDYGLRAPSPLAHFQQRMLPPEDKPRAGIPSLRHLEADWLDTLQHQASLAKGLAAAVAAELDAIRRSAADDDLRALRVQRVLAAQPDDPKALALLVEIESERHELDAALLAARHLAAIRPVHDEHRFAELSQLNSRLGSELEADDQLLRDDIERLVGRYRARGFPRTALAVLEAVLTAVPHDAGYMALRNTLLELYDLDDLVLRHEVPLEDAVKRAYGDRSMWLMKAGELKVRLADRVQPDTLRGLIELRAPCQVAVTMELVTREGHHDGGRFAGLTFGAAAPEQHGQWGLFTTPSGQVELATRGMLEWPSDEIGRVLPGPVRLEIRFHDARFEVFANSVALGSRPYGARPSSGWLGLYVRRAEATFRDLVITYQHNAPPPRPWYADGRP